MAKVEGILEQMDKRLNHIETRLTRLDDRMWAVLAGIVLAILVPILLRVLRI